MPGLVVAVGAPDAERRVRRAAQPVLRRPWERLSVVASARADVALGFAGERGGVATDRSAGVLVAFDGELAHPCRTGGQAAQELLDLYARHGSDLDPPDGAWAAALWNERTSELVLLTDRCLGRPLYVGRAGGATIAAGELKALVAAGVPARIDPQAWAELLAYEQPVSEQCLLADVRKLPGGATLVLGEREELRTRWRFRVEPAKRGDEDELVEEFADVFERAVLGRVSSDSALALSGGLDSRCIAAVLAANDVACLTATYGAPGSADLRHGTEIATRAGLPHVALPLHPGYLVRGAPEIVWLDEGRMRCFHAHHLALRALRAEGSGSLLVGLHGDSVMRDTGVPHAGPEQDEFVDAGHAYLSHAVTDDAHEEVFRPAFASELRGRARAALAAALADDGRERRSVWKELLWYGDSPMTDFDDHLVGRDPFGDRDVIELCRKLPTVLRERGRLERAYLRRYPALSDVSSPKLGLSPRTTGWRETARHGRLRVRSKVTAALDALLGAGRREDRSGIADYGAELRRSGADLLSILLEPRTLDRGQLREEGVARLVHDTLAGRVSHTKTLGMLLTLELFQRQFVDGEPPSLNGSGGGGA